MFWLSGPLDGAYHHNKKPIPSNEGEVVEFISEEGTENENQGPL